MPSCPLKTEVALMLLKLRTKYGYSQVYIADCLGLSRNAYLNWENGNVDFKLSQ